MNGPPIAHETGTLEWGAWVDDCLKCRRVCYANPRVLLVLKADTGRAVVKAAHFADLGAEVLTAQYNIGAIREVFVCQEQNATVGRA